MEARRSDQPDFWSPSVFFGLFGRALEPESGDILEPSDAITPDRGDQSTHDREELGVATWERIFDKLEERAILDADGVAACPHPFAREQIGDDGAQVLGALVDARETNGASELGAEARGEERVELAALEEGPELAGRRQAETHVERLGRSRRRATLRQGFADRLLDVTRERGAVSQKEEPAMGENER